MHENIKKLHELLQQKHYEQAYAYIKEIQQIPLANVKIAYDLAKCFHHLKKYDDLESLTNQLQQQMPNEPNLFSLYVLLSLRDDMENIHQRLKYLRQAIKLNPNDFTAYYNIGCYLKDKYKYKAAKKFFLLAAEKAPDRAEIYLNLGLIAEIEKQPEQEKQYYLKAIALKPDLAEAHMNLGMSYLNEQNYQQGWVGYEWRLKMPGLYKLSQIYTKPRWQGELLANKTLIIVCEQGYGDAIQFVRYIPLIKKHGGKIILICRPALLDLLKMVDGLDECITTNEAIPEYDYYCPLLSLPFIFKTEKTSIPAKVPYLQVDAQKQAKWHEYFQQYQDQFKVGIAWAGSKGHQNDYYRSIKPRDFSQLADITGLTLFCLQKEATKNVCDQYGFKYINDKLHDFTDTAACISELDLIISVDTALVHLAGALNLPVWVLMAQVHDWRWQDERNDNPWYPSLKLYRQRKLRCWQDVFEDIKRDLKSTI